MLVEHAKRIFYTLCNELWKLKLECEVDYLGKSNETASVQFKNKEGILYATVQYNKIQHDDIGYVTLRFYNHALLLTEVYDFVQKYQDHTNRSNDFAKYAKGNKGKDGKEYCEFQFEDFIQDQTIRDIKKLLRKIDLKLEKIHGDTYLLSKLPREKIMSLPKGTYKGV